MINPAREYLKIQSKYAHDLKYLVKSKTIKVLLVYISLNLLDLSQFYI